MKDLINRIKTLKDNPNNNLYLDGPLMQTTVLLEEAVKIQQNIIKYDIYTDRSSKYGGVFSTKNEKEEIVTTLKEAIGSIFIDLIMLNVKDPQIKIDIDYENIRLTPFRESMYLFDFIASIQNHMTYRSDYKNASRQVSLIIHSLKVICESYNLDLKECIEQAYENIEEK